jgi:hypothetical protein
VWQVKDFFWTDQKNFGWLCAPLLPNFHGLSPRKDLVRVARLCG